MTARMCIAGSWDFQSYSAGSLTLTDSAGAHAPITPSSGRFEHNSICYDAGASNPPGSFAAALQLALNYASPTRSYTVTWSLITGKYTITVDSGTFSATLGTGFARLLGVTGVITSTGTTWTSPFVPWFVIIPAKPGPSLYKTWSKPADAIKESRNDQGKPYRLGPTSVVRSSVLEFSYEPKERIDAQWVFSAPANTHLYSWPQLWDDFGLAQCPIGIYIEQGGGDYELVACSLTKPMFDDSVAMRMRANDDFRFKVSMAIEEWSPGSRSFNA